MQIVCGSNSGLGDGDSQIAVSAGDGMGGSSGNCHHLIPEYRMLSLQLGLWARKAINLSEMEDVDVCE